MTETADEKDVFVVVVVLVVEGDVVNGGITVVVSVVEVDVEVNVEVVLVGTIGTVVVDTTGGVVVATTVVVASFA